MATTAGAVLLSEHTLQPLSDPPAESTDELRKISAYYSLVFPNFTYYLQTLNVTIGRRCTPLVPGAAGSSLDAQQQQQDNNQAQVDVDLGPLKSVSRLHARIEYEEDEERFVLFVMGRNGAWVDGVWSGSGSKVPLGERSQIQIASRTFHFILPPPPAPEDSPSPSSQSQSSGSPSGNRPRSPSIDDVDIVDITSLSPASSIPSASPPPATKTTSAAALKKHPPSTLPNSNTIPVKPTSKKRKKSVPNAQHAQTQKAKAKVKEASPAPVVPPPPDMMPLKPQLTYAQLCYRAIKALHGKASLQEICQWIRETHEWYKYNSKGWESSVRHNLSSNPGFKKLARGKDEKGKGALWAIDEAHEHAFEEQEVKRQANLALAASASTSTPTTAPNNSTTTATTKAKGKGTGKNAVPLDSPFRRSVKGGPLPPPLTSTPLPLRTNVSHAPNVSVGGGIAQGSGAAPQGVKLEHPTPFTSAPSSSSTTAPPSLPLSTATPTATTTSVSSTGAVSLIPAPSTSASPPLPAWASASTSASTSTPGLSPFPAIPASVRLPILIAPPPSPSSPPNPSQTPTPSRPIILASNTLLLDRTIFAPLTPAHLRDLEALGAQKALEILQAFIVRYYKEQLRAEGGARGGRGRGRGRGRGASAGGAAHAHAQTNETTPVSAPAYDPPMASLQPDSLVPPTSASALAPDSAAAPPASSAQPEDPPSPIVVIDDDEDGDGDEDDAEQPAAKRRRV